MIIYETTKKQDHSNHFLVHVRLGNQATHKQQGDRDVRARTMFKKLRIVRVVLFTHLFSLHIRPSSFVAVRFNNESKINSQD